MNILKTTNKEYTLKVNTRALVKMEARLGRNPLNVFMTLENNELPKMNDIFIILHEAINPLNHGVSFDDMYDIYDSYCAEGGNLVQLLELLVKVFQDDGVIPKEVNEKN